MRWLDIVLPLLASSIGCSEKQDSPCAQGEVIKDGRCTTCAPGEAIRDGRCTTYSYEPQPLPPTPNTPSLEGDPAPLLPLLHKAQAAHRSGKMGDAYAFLRDYTAKRELIAKKPTMGAQELELELAQQIDKLERAAGHAGIIWGTNFSATQDALAKQQLFPQSVEIENGQTALFTNHKMLWGLTDVSKIYMFSENGLSKVRIRFGSAFTRGRLVQVLVGQHGKHYSELPGTRIMVSDGEVEFYSSP